VFPYADHLPAEIVQPGVRVAVAFAVCFDLCPPPSRVCFRPRPVRRATMPKTAIEENCQAMSRKCDVSSTTQARQLVIDAEAQPSAVKK
jgi:hypothetical protein